MFESNHRFADLHLHTNLSDGAYSPKELIDKLLPFGLKAIAIVDHDEVGALEDAIRYGKKQGLEVIPGVELSVRFKHIEIHLLGYFIDFQNEELKEYLKFVKSERIKRVERIIKKLEKSGIYITLDRVLQQSGDGSVGRPHIAKVLVEEGYVFSFQEAFNKYLANNQPAYEPNYKIEIHEALNLITSAGGISCIAHPGIDLTDEALITLIKAGVQGIETIHPKHNSAQTEFYSRLAKKFNLLETGGSDYHGGSQSHETLGQYKVPYSVVEQMKKITGN
ncbi:MAG: PHP domain-containing protein [Calditrichaeota bacterium]|nr:MAG: PHP domain-containing protein [Calditrichota bacterium]